MLRLAPRLALSRSAPVARARVTAVAAPLAIAAVPGLRAPASPVSLQVRCKSKKAGKGKGRDDAATEPASGSGSGSGVAAEKGEAFDAEALVDNMKRAVERCGKTVATLVGSLGRADPALLDSVRVESGKTTYPLRDFATVGVRDGSLLVTCFDVANVKQVERAIYKADLGFTPQTGVAEEETMLRIPIPKPTAETRQALVKDVTRICENARVSIRSARHTAQKQIKTDIDNKVVGRSEGDKDMKRIEADTKKYTAQVDALFEKTKKTLLST